MTEAEKAAKYDTLATLLWSWVYHGNPLQQTMGAALIRELRIVGPDGEDPESA